MEDWKGVANQRNYLILRSFEFVRFFYRAHSNDARGVTKAEVLPVIVLVRLNLCCVGNNKHPRISGRPRKIPACVRRPYKELSRSTLTSQTALRPAGPPQSAQCSSGLSPGPFCVEFACSPRVHKGFPPLRTPTEKTYKITEHMSIPDQRWTVHFTWSPGATSRPLLLGGVLEEGQSRMGKSRK